MELWGIPIIIDESLPPGVGYIVQAEKVSMAKDIQVGDIIEVIILSRRKDEEVTYTGKVTRVDSQVVEIGNRMLFKFRHRWTIIRTVRRGHD